MYDIAGILADPIRIYRQRYMNVINELLVCLCADIDKGYES